MVATTGAGAGNGKACALAFAAAGARVAGAGIIYYGGHDTVTLIETGRESAAH